MGIPVFNQWAEYFVIDEPPMHARGRSGKCERGQQNEWCRWQKRQDNADHAEHQGNNAKTEPYETLHDRTAGKCFDCLTLPQGEAHSKPKTGLQARGNHNLWPYNSAIYAVPPRGCAAPLPARPPPGLGAHEWYRQHLPAWPPFQWQDRTRRIARRRRRRPPASRQ